MSGRARRWSHASHEDSGLTCDVRAPIGVRASRSADPVDSRGFPGAVVTRRPSNGSVHTTDDETLIAAAAQGDEMAFGQLFRRYASRLLGFLVQLLGRRDVAEEVLQEVFLEAWRGAAKFDASRASFRSWIFLLARSRALDRIRSTKSRAEREERHAAPAPDSLDPRAQEVARATVERALGLLSEEQRVCVRMAFYEGLSLSQVASALDVPLGTVKSRYLYGMRMLRTRFGAAGEQGAGGGHV